MRYCRDIATTLRLFHFFVAFFPLNCFAFRPTTSSKPLPFFSDFLMWVRNQQSCVCRLHGRLHKIRAAERLSHVRSRGFSDHHQGSSSGGPLGGGGQSMLQGMRRQGGLEVDARVSAKLTSNDAKPSRLTSFIPWSSFF